MKTHVVRSSASTAIVTGVHAGIWWIVEPVQARWPARGGGSDVWRYSVPAAQARWAAINRCTSGPATVSVTTHVTRSSYPNCAADTVLCTISDVGGHTWPGTPAASPGNGTTIQKISANTLMWPFFQRFTLPT